MKLTPLVNNFLTLTLIIKAMAEPGVDGEDIEPRLKLECVASWRLFGWVQVGLHHFPLSSVHCNFTEHGKRQTDWWRKGLSSACFQKC